MSEIGRGRSASHHVLPLTVHTWSRLTFIHWAYPPEQVTPLLPAGLEVDTFEGMAWVGLVPFLMTVRPASRRLPALPGAFSIPETNVRTYARDPRGLSGVWFLSLDVIRLLFVLGARAAYGLPYFWSRMSVRQEGPYVRYEGRRKAGGRGGYEIAVETTEAVTSGPLEDFLTARWRLYTRLAGRLCEARVEHAAWPLRQAWLTGIDQDIVQASGLPQPGGEPVVQYAPRLDVRVGPPRPL
jgi:uncharacterized protein YqjF (DUF2071 family)